MDNSFDLIFSEEKKEKLEEYCPSCHADSSNFTNVINEGATVCKKCGTYVSNILLSAKSDWQDINDSSCIINPLLVKQSQTILLVGVPYWIRKNHDYCNVYSHGEQGLNELYRTIDKIGSRNNIQQAILDYVKKTCKNIKTENMKRGNLRLGLIGAIIKMAYKERNIYFSEAKMAEMCRIDKKYIQNGVNTLAELNFDKGINTSTYRPVQSYLNEYIRKLQLEDELVDGINELFLKIESKIPRIHNTPSSIAGACLYYAFKKSYGKVEGYAKHLDNLKIVLKKHCNLNYITVHNCYANLVKVIEEK
jgi:transcription initiation factor TFIIIB Brf1 subunit/transcription initiation factor TFIIB